MYVYNKLLYFVLFVLSTCAQVEHVLFEDLKGFKMCLLQVPLADDRVIAAKNEVLGCIHANSESPIKFVLLGVPVYVGTIMSVYVISFVGMLQCMMHTKVCWMALPVEKWISSSKKNKSWSS